MKRVEVNEQSYVGQFHAQTALVECVAGISATDAVHGHIEILP